MNTNDQNNFIPYCLQNPTFIKVNKFCPNCNETTMQNEKKEIFTKPFDIIIYIKQDGQNNISNISYPISFNLPMNQALQTGNNCNMDIYNLKAVIQQQIQNGEKSYGCTFAFQNNWYFGNGYNIMNCDNSPYKFNYGNVVMLFYSSEK